MGFSMQSDFLFLISDEEPQPASYMTAIYVPKRRKFDQVAEANWGKEKNPRKYLVKALHFRDQRGCDPCLIAHSRVSIPRASVAFPASVGSSSQVSLLVPAPLFTQKCSMDIPFLELRIKAMT